MMIEDKSTYAYQLRHLANPSFDKIRNFAKDFIMKLPEQLKDELYEEIERGEKQLETEPELMYYLHAFGKMHRAKLNYAFEHLPETFFEIPEINIIDYGCGQAVATMCYAVFLRKQGNKQKIRRVTLIEPSEAALKRAALHVSVFFPDAEIVTINKEFDDLETKDIVCDEDRPTLHLLSNVLDLECFSLITFKKLVKKRIGPSNLFVCVGPYFGDNDRGKRLDSFAKSMKGEEMFSEDLDAYELDEDNSWTCMVRCFKKGDWEEDLSTYATKEKIANGIEDEYGVVYSKDGKRLLGTRKRLFTKYCDFETYTIKKGVKIICDNAFYWCKSLQSIVIPESVTSIGVNPFVDSGIRSIVSHSRFFTVDRKALYDQKKKQLIVCFSKGYHFVIPDNVASIGDSAFSLCKSLRSIVIPNSVTNIGNSAFSRCESLQSIVIPTSVTNIGDFAFWGCKSLQSLIIPNSVTNIGDRPFSFCSSLRSIVIPNSVTSIGGWAFSHCRSLRSIVISNSVKNIGDFAFYECGLQSIVIPNSVTSIGYSAFSFCISLQTIVIPDSVTQIRDSAFHGCDSLQSIVIPKGSRAKFKKILYEEFWDKLVEE